MRIVNKDFKDYYDSCMGYGVDETLIYVRKSIEYVPNYSQKIKNDFQDVLNLVARKRYDNVIEYYFSNRELTDKKGRKHEFKIGYIGFCGKVYPYIKIHISAINSINTRTIFVYSQKEMMDHIKTFDLNIKERQRWWHDEVDFTSKHLKELFVVVEMQEVFFNIGNPVFIMDRNGIVVNPCLKDYQFFKVFDPFSSFQELSMFLSGVLGQAHPPMDNISDEHMKRKKGFNDLSFKNQEHKRKSKRNKNGSS